MKKIISLALALCMLLSTVSGALAAPYDATKPACQTPGHEKYDGVDHDRPQSCWTKGHFACDGMDHEKAACGLWGHVNCDCKDHTPAACGAEGHFACKGKHEAAACGVEGHCVSDGLKHTAAGCGVEGHLLCDGLKHKAAACGLCHLACDGADHSKAVCGHKNHYNCDGLNHAPAICGKRGHCADDGLNHGAAECGYAGHIGCTGKHGVAVCGVEGHYACESGHTTAVNPFCMAEPQHTKCQKDEEHFCDPANGGCGETYLCKDSNKHTTCEMCGLLWCDDSLGSHYTPCGNRNHRQCYYKLQGKVWRASDHPKCHLCGGGKCSGRHGEGVCVPLCSQCGEVLKDGKTHRAKCGKHYLCITKGRDHGWCSDCGQLKCLGESKKHECSKK